MFAVIGTSSQSRRVAVALQMLLLLLLIHLHLHFSICATAGLHFTYPKDKKAAIQAANVPVETRLQHSSSDADSNLDDRGFLSDSEPSSRGAVKDSASSSRALLRKTDSGDGVSLKTQQEVVCRLGLMGALALQPVGIEWPTVYSVSASLWVRTRLGHA